MADGECNALVRLKVSLMRSSDRTSVVTTRDLGEFSFVSLGLMFCIERTSGRIYSDNP